MNSMPDEARSEVTARAVLYLRVSTVDQARRGGESEGYSLPAQREACLRKAEALGAVVVGEYVDGGESARTDQRSGLQAMLERIKTARDVEFVIVHKVNRWARNRYDDALLGATLGKASVQFVSAAENIDSTPSGRLLHGILATIAEFESANLASEVIKGATQKAKAGGTPRLAPLGYLNVGDVIDGREVRTVILDPDRAEIIRWAFHAYATGDYSLVRLLDELTARGLTTRGNRRYPSQPLQLSKLHLILRNPYYKGIVRYRGVDYPGRHEALVDAEMFEQVQAALRSHRNGEKQRTHNHYLRGSLFCGHCGGRLCFTKARGKGGTLYPYYFCINRHQRASCQLPYIPLKVIEQAIASRYRTIQLGEDEAKELRKLILEAADQLNAQNGAEVVRQQRRLARLEKERVKLLRAHYAEAIPMELLRSEQERISREAMDAESAIRQSQTEAATIEAGLDKALALATECGHRYPAASPLVRRLFNQAFFERFEVTSDYEVTAELKEPFSQLVEAASQRNEAMSQGNGRHESGSVYQRTFNRGRGSVHRPDFSGWCLKETLVVGDRGFEPR